MTMWANHLAHMVVLNLQVAVLLYWLIMTTKQKIV